MAKKDTCLLDFHTELLCRSSICLPLIILMHGISQSVTLAYSVYKMVKLSSSISLYSPSFGVEERELILSLEVVHTAPLLWLWFWFQWQNQSYLSTDSCSVASSVWVLALALISLLLETEQTEPHLKVVLKSMQFWQLSLNTHLYKLMIKQN